MIHICVYPSSSNVIELIGKWHIHTYQPDLIHLNFLFLLSHALYPWFQWHQYTTTSSIVCIITFALDPFSLYFYPFFSFHMLSSLRHTYIKFFIRSQQQQKNGAFCHWFTTRKIRVCSTCFEGPLIGTENIGQTHTANTHTHLEHNLFFHLSGLVVNQFQLACAAAASPFFFNSYYSNFSVLSMNQFEVYRTPRQSC